jgi:hypothetical protein
MKQHHPNDTIRRKFEGLVERRPDGSLNWTADQDEDTDTVVR